MNNESIDAPHEHAALEIPPLEDQPVQKTLGERIIEALLASTPQMTGKKVVVVLSGGQDSTTCLFLCKMYGCEIHAVTFDYGQRHSRELEAAKRVGELAGVASHEFIKLGDGILASTSPLVDKSATLEQYTDHQSLPGGLEKTFVPMRNLLFLTIAANRAYALGAQCLVTGVCEEDSGGYPDCRRDFIEMFANTIAVGAFTGENGAPGDFGIFTPLMSLTKAESVKLAVAVPGAYAALAYSHTAYDGEYPPVGKDHASLLRAKGFEQAGYPDPLVLRAVGDDMMDIPDTENYSHEKIEASTEMFRQAEEQFGWELE